MPISLEKVIPFGRVLDEYIRLFDLTEQDLQKNIVSVADGPASFQSEMNKLGRSVISVDPIYQFSAKEIEAQFNAVVDDVITQVANKIDQWNWTYHKNPETLQEIRTTALNRFLADFEQGKINGRYIADELPSLPFEDNQFELALCSHFLFLYSGHLTADFHHEAIAELLRIAPEIRIFPLLTLTHQTSPYLDDVCNRLREAGHTAEIIVVPYEFQQGGNQMLSIRRKAEG